MNKTNFETALGTIYGYHSDGRNICAKCARETINDLELCRRWQPLTTSETCDECGAAIEQAERVFSVISSIKAQYKAKYWIDNRDNNARSLINKEAK